MGSYTSEALVAAEVGLTQFSTDTRPTLAQVTLKISEVESKIDSIALSKKYATGVYADVNYTPVEVESFVSDYSNQTNYSNQLGANTPYLRIEGLILPASQLPFRPILTVSSLQRRTSGITEVPTWETLTQWDGSSGTTDYLKLTADNGFGVEVGWALKFIGRQPSVGDKRLKMDYWWGWDLPAHVLQEYATLLVARWAAQIRLNSPSPIGAKVSITGGSNLDVVTGRAENAVLRSITDRLMQLESKLPRKLYHVAQKTLR